MIIISDYNEIKAKIPEIGEKFEIQKGKENLSTK